VYRISLSTSFFTYRQQMLALYNLRLDNSVQSQLLSCDGPFKKKDK
jgi:hypothetical protein